MAKVVINAHLEASNGARTMFKSWPGMGGNPDIPCFDITVANWPLAEFEDLVKYVRNHITEQAATGESKLSELAPEDLVPGGDK